MLCKWGCVGLVEKILRMSRVMRKKVNAQMNDRGDFSLPSVMYTNMYVFTYLLLVVYL